MKNLQEIQQISILPTHYLGEWIKPKNTEKSVEKLEEYESIHLNVKKLEVNSEVRQKECKKYVSNEASQKSKQP